MDVTRETARPKVKERRVWGFRFYAYLADCHKFVTAGFQGRQIDDSRVTLFSTVNQTFFFVRFRMASPKK